MKKGIIALGLLASLSAYSQESYVPQAGEGIVYFLPKTKVAIDIIATKVDYQPGDFSHYASRNLRLDNIRSRLPAGRLQPLCQPLPAPEQYQLTARKPLGNQGYSSPPCRSARLY